LIYPKVNCTRVLGSLREMLWRHKQCQENVLHGGGAHKPFSRGNLTPAQIWEQFSSICSSLAAQCQHCTGMTASHAQQPVQCLTTTTLLFNTWSSWLGLSPAYRGLHHAPLHSADKLQRTTARTCLPVNWFQLIAHGEVFADASSLPWLPLDAKLSVSCAAATIPTIAWISPW